MWAYHLLVCYAKEKRSSNYNCAFLFPAPQILNDIIFGNKKVKWHIFYFSILLLFYHIKHSINQILCSYLPDWHCSINMPSSGAACSACSASMWIPNWCFLLHVLLDPFWNWSADWRTFSASFKIDTWIICQHLCRQLDFSCSFLSVIYSCGVLSSPWFSRKTDLS